MKNYRAKITGKKIGINPRDKARIVEINYGNDSFRGGGIGVEYRGQFYMLSTSRALGGDYVVYLEKIKKGLIAKKHAFLGRKGTLIFKTAGRDVAYKPNNLERALISALNNGCSKARVSMPIIFSKFKK